MTADTNYEIVLYRKGTAGTITMIYDDNSFVISGSRAWSKNENDVGDLVFNLSNGSIVPAENFMNPSFAGWSGGVTGALQLGDYVKYSLYPTKTGAKTQVFFGKITNINHTSDGQLRVTAMDYLKALMREVPKIIYDGYRDSLSKSVTWSGGVASMSSISETGGIVTPFAEVALLLDDSRLSLGSGGVLSSADICDAKAAAQAFFAPGTDIIGCNMGLATDPSYNPTVTASLCSDDAGVPGAVLASASAVTTYITEFYDFDFTGGTGIPIKVIKGGKYWIKFTAPASSANEVNTEAYNNTSYVVSGHLTYDGTAWSAVTNKQLYLKIDSADATIYESSSYTYVSSTLYINAGVSAPSATQSYVTVVRGTLSYYYGTKTNQEIADALLALNTGLISSTSANQNATSGTFSSLGKKLLEALQELSDQYQPSGTWSGYQLAFAHYESAGAQYLKWGKRLSTADSSYVTFSHGSDSSTDEEVRIIDYSGLSMRTDLRPPRVVVIGTDSSDNPICYTVTDRALADSFESRMEGFANAQKVVDANLVTMADVRSRGDGAIAQYAFNVWEGNIVVSGVYPELIDLDTGSASFGSGKIITLNLSPLGISNQKFKVKGVQVEANQTTITISNVDLATMNVQKYYNYKSNKTEAFYAPVGLADNVYIAVFCDSTVSGSAYHMTLEDSAGTAITSLVPVLCAKHIVAAYNLNVYQGIFEKDNGYSTPPYGVRYIRLYSGATLIATYDLYSASAPVRDERFDKFKTMRLIVDFMTKIA
jgi:hypothetical protein